MGRVYAYFMDDHRLRRASFLFKRGLYLLVIFKCVQWLSVYSYLFGENSIVSFKDTRHLFSYQQPAFWLYNLKSGSAGLFFILPCLLLSLLGWFKKSIPYLGDLVLWLLVVNIHNRIYPTLTGGEVLMNQLLLFSSFVSMSYRSDGTFPVLRKCAHNFAVISIMAQVCFVYLMSALAKAQDASWMEGSALIKTLSASQYSGPFLMHASSQWPGLFIVLNYLVLAYQLCFPALIWFRRIKKPFIALGVMIHLFIALGMGLFSFGVVMILCYIIFWPFEE